jgi:hypothetical protein
MPIMGFYVLSSGGDVRYDIRMKRCSVRLYL